MVGAVSLSPVSTSSDKGTTRDRAPGDEFLASVQGAAPGDVVHDGRPLNLPLTNKDVADTEAVLRAGGASPEHLAQRARQNGKLVVTIVDDFRTPMMFPKTIPAGTPLIGTSHGQHVIDSFYDRLTPEQRQHVEVRKIDFGNYRKSDGTVDYAAALREAERQARAGETDLVNISNEPARLDLYANPESVPDDEKADHPDTLQSLLARRTGAGSCFGSTAQLNDANERAILQGLGESDPELARAIKDLGTLQHDGYKVPVVVAAGNDNFAQAVALSPGVIVVGARSSVPLGIGNSTSPGNFKDATEDGTLGGGAFTSFAAPRVVRDFVLGALDRAGLAPLAPSVPPNHPFPVR